MVKNIALAIFLSLVCNTFALNENFSPVLVFKHKENQKNFEKSVISATTQMEQREFERLVSTYKGEKVIIMVTKDMSPEDFIARDEKHVKAFQHTAQGSTILEYHPLVENAVNNKITNGNDVEYVSVSTTNELEPEPSTDATYTIVQLPGYHAAETRFHYFARCDRIIDSIVQQHKDAIFIFTSEKNSRLQKEEHSRKRRATDEPKPQQHKDENVFVYFKDLKKDFKKTTQADASIPITSISSTKNSATRITVDIKSEYSVSFVFDFDESTTYWHLNAAESTFKDQKPINLSLQIGAPKEFSFSCSSDIYFAEKDDKSDISGVYFERFQIQLKFGDDTQSFDKFADSYDCTGFTSIPIWSGLFITFLLLGIVAAGISYIMDIRTMDRFDDPKGKTITVTATE